MQRLTCALAATVALSGCAAIGPKRVTVGGSETMRATTTQTAVAPVYPPAYPATVTTVTRPAAVADPAATTRPAAIEQPAPVVTVTEVTFYPPTQPSPPTVLTTTATQTTRAEASTTVDIVPPKNWGGYWIGVCLTIAAACAVAATVTPVKRLYAVAIAAAALASLALVPPAYLGVAVLAVAAALIAAVAVLVWRAGVWERATVQVVRGVETVKSAVGDPDEVNRMLAAEQDESTKKIVRRARGK